MFRHPSWAVGSYSSGPFAPRAVGTNLTRGFYRRNGSPCIYVSLPSPSSDSKSNGSISDMRNGFLAGISHMMVGRVRNMHCCSCDGIAERISDSEIGLTAAVAHSLVFGCYNTSHERTDAAGGRRCLSLELKSCQLAELIGDEASVVRDSVDRRTRIDLVFLPPQKIRTSSDIIVSLGRVSRSDTPSGTDG